MTALPCCSHFLTHNESPLFTMVILVMILCTPYVAFAQINAISRRRWEREFSCAIGWAFPALMVAREESQGVRGANERQRAPSTDGTGSPSDMWIRSQCNRNLASSAPLDDQPSPPFATWIRSQCDRNLPVPVASVIGGASVPLSPLPSISLCRFIWR